MSDDDKGRQSEAAAELEDCRDSKPVQVSVVVLTIANLHLCWGNKLYSPDVFNRGEAGAEQTGQ